MMRRAEKHLGSRSGIHTGMRPIENIWHMLLLLLLDVIGDSSLMKLFYFPSSSKAYNTHS